MLITYKRHETVTRTRVFECWIPEDDPIHMQAAQVALAEADAGVRIFPAPTATDTVSHAGDDWATCLDRYVLDNGVVKSQVSWLEECADVSATVLLDVEEP